jgi:hypothetical protein
MSIVLHQPIYSINQLNYTKTLKLCLLTYSIFEMNRIR